MDFIKPAFAHTLVAFLLTTGFFFIFSSACLSQNVGIGTNAPQSTLDVKGNQRIGGANHFMTYDSASGKYSWSSSYIWAPAAQYLMMHSASAEGLYYNNAQLQYLNSVGNPVFFTNWNNGYSYFSARLGIGVTTPLARLHVADSNVVFTGPPNFPSVFANPPISGYGKRMLWYAEKAAFRAGFVSDNQWDKDSIGVASFASGSNSKAIGDGSTAISSGIARGLTSTAIGLGRANGDFSIAAGDASADGYSSTAVGYGAIASGRFSISIGYRTVAKASNSLVVGQGNDITDNPDPLNEALSDRLFQIGNGSFLSGPRRNALTILRNGRTGIGTPNPLARLHVTDSSVVFSVPGNITGGVQPTPISGIGRRMMWYSDKAAFRVGYVDGNNWYQDNVGDYSFATGNNTKASAPYSTAMGANTIASWYYSTAMGENTTASGSNSTAMGGNTIASGGGSLAGGYNSTASGFGSTAIGYYTTSKAWGGMAVGMYNDATDNPDQFIAGFTDRIFQVGIGISDFSRKNALTVLRNGNIGIGILSPTEKLHIAEGGIRIEGPVALGGTVPAFSIGGFGDMQVDAWGSPGGRFIVKENGNVGIGNPSPDFPLSFAPALGDKISLWGGTGDHYGIGIQSNQLQIHTDASFSDIVLGYGRSAAFIERMRIKGNGNVGIGTNNPLQKLQVAGNICATGTIGSCSDIRYKKDLSPIKRSLQAVLSLTGIYYYWKQEEFPFMEFTASRQLGFSAQKVEKLFPEVVMTDASGYKSVDYGRLTPVLVEAIKEQQQQINQQQQQIDELKKLVEKILQR